MKMRLKKRKSYEGLQENIRRLKTPKIETWENKYSQREYTVALSFPEFTCICPKTGLPDFATVKINYAPARLCLELKSLKFYLLFFRDIGIFHEHLVNKILDDIVKACRPRWVSVEGIMNPRGGIQTTVTAQYPSSPAGNIVS